jgi:hypothetical protein
MDNGSVEAHDLIESVTEGLEEREHKRDAWNIRVALTTSLLAVFAALSNLESEQWTSEAILLKNSAIFFQAKSSDQWSYYQAKKIKLHMSEKQLRMETLVLKKSQATIEKEKFTKLIDKYNKQVKQIKHNAQDFEKQRDALNLESDAALRHHRAFALSVVCFQIAIVLTSMAVMLRRSSLWYTSMGLGVFGVIAFINGFMLFFHLGKLTR